MNPTEAFVTNLLAIWNAPENKDIHFGKKAWDSLSRAMVFAGQTDLAGADKKQLVLDILALLLEKTDSPGPDFIVDAFFKQVADYGIDALYDAFKGKFNFDGEKS